MAGRDLVPGEKSLYDRVGRNSVFNRTLRAQVSAVNQENGFTSLNYYGTPTGGKYATVAPLWLSIPQNAGPAWGRFMPQVSDFVKVSFDYDDHPHIIGYDVIAGDNKIADWHSGWPQLNKLFQNANNGPNPAMAKFIQLQSGEYDFMSTGGAYIYGNNVGRLYMAGGPISGTGFMSVLQLGNNTTNANQGSVTDNSPITNNPSRYSYYTYDPNGNLVHHTAVDASGNLDIFSNSATQMNFKFPSGTWTTNFSTTSHTDTTKTTYTTPQFNVDSPEINLGNTAINPLLVTTIYRPAEDTLLTAFNTTIDAINALNLAAASTAATAFTTLSTTSPIGSPASPEPTCVAAAVAATALSAGIPTLLLTLNTALTTFLNAAQSYLSQVSKTQ